MPAFSFGQRNGYQLMSRQGESATPAFKETIRDLRNRHPAPGPDPGAVDETFNQSMASLSAQLAARFAKDRPTNDRRREEDVRIAAPRVERPPTKPSEEPRPAQRRRGGLLIGLLAGCLATAVAAGVLAFFPATKAPPPSPAPPKVAAALPSPPTATDTRPSILDPAPSPPPRAEPTPPPPPPPPPVDVPLGRGEILDVQTRLKALGLNPGPLDGVAGPMTVAAAKRYAESRGRSAASAVDRELLRALQQETR